MNGHPISKTPRILIGYSLGGRLALHALIDRPHQWLAAIIVSAHVGLEDPQERKERKLLDQKWAERFESEVWSNLMQAWNSREVFAHDPFQFKRLERDYQRSYLANILTRGSLGEQMYLKQQIESLPMPILWVTGKNDIRYSQIAKTLTFAHPHSQWVEVEQAGHRVPWVQPQVFKKLVENFLQEFGCITTE